MLALRLLFASGANVLWFYEHYGCEDGDRIYGGVALLPFAMRTDNASNGNYNYNLKRTAVTVIRMQC